MMILKYPVFNIGWLWQWWWCSKTGQIPCTYIFEEDDLYNTHPFIMLYCWALANIFPPFRLGSSLGSWNDSFVIFLLANEMVGFLQLLCFNLYEICRNKILPKIVSSHSVGKNWCNQFSITNLFDELLREAESWYTYLNEITTWSKHSVMKSRICQNMEALQY